MTREILTAAALDAFEQLGFLLADPEPGGTGSGLDGMRVAFHGPTRGAVVVRGDRTLLEVLSMSMMGLDEPPPPELQRDALGEIANVICGNVVPTSDPEGVYRLAAPTAVGADEPRTEAVRCAVVLGFEGGVTRIEWTEERP